MKKLVLTSLLFFAVFRTDCYAQWINSISVTPAFPTSNDSLKVFVDCSFSSGSCDPYFASVSINGNDIYASALHCLGMLTFICSYTDTFLIAPLQAGNYTFHMQLDAGGGPAPCTPGIVPGPVDSVVFTITQATGIAPVDLKPAFRIIVDAGTDRLTILAPAQVSAEPGFVRIYASDGRAVLAASISETSTILHKRLPHGIYVASLQIGVARYLKKIVVLN